MGIVKDEYSNIESSWIQTMLDKLPSDIHIDLGEHIINHSVYQVGMNSNEGKGKIKFETKSARDNNTMYRLGVWKIPKIGEFIHRDMQAVVCATKKFDNQGKVLNATLDFYCIYGHGTEPQFGNGAIEHDMLILSKELDGEPLNEYDLQMCNPIALKVLFCVLQIVESEKKKNEKTKKGN